MTFSYKFLRLFLDEEVLALEFEDGVKYIPRRKAEALARHILEQQEMYPKEVMEWKKN